MSSHNEREISSKELRESNDAESVSEITTSSSAFVTEKPEAIWTRTKVILAFWAIIIFMGLPMWWKTTSIYRAKLPLEKMNEWAEGKVLYIYTFIMFLF